MKLFGDDPEDDLVDDETRKIMAELRKHTQYHEDHPDQCPHHAMVSPILEDEDGTMHGDQPGQCLDCWAYPVMERETDCPLCAQEE